jgi:3-hydroxybutyryl-CoA dehydrogenase
MIGKAVQRYFSAGVKKIGVIGAG